MAPTALVPESTVRGSRLELLSRSVGSWPQSSGADVRERTRLCCLHEERAHEIVPIPNGRRRIRPRSSRNGGCRKPCPTGADAIGGAIDMILSARIRACRPANDDMLRTIGGRSQRSNPLRSHHSPIRSRCHGGHVGGPGAFGTVAADHLCPLCSISGGTGVRPPRRKQLSQSPRARVSPDLGRTRSHQARNSSNPVPPTPQSGTPRRQFDRRTRSHRQRTNALPGIPVPDPNSFHLSGLREHLTQNGPESATTAPRLAHRRPAAGNSRRVVLVHLVGRIPTPGQGRTFPEGLGWRRPSDRRETRKDFPDCEPPQPTSRFARPPPATESILESGFPSCPGTSHLA